LNPLRGRVLSSPPGIGVSIRLAEISFLRAQPTAARVDDRISNAGGNLANGGRTPVVASGSGIVKHRGHPSTLASGWLTLGVGWAHGVREDQIIQERMTDFVLALASIRNRRRSAPKIISYLSPRKFWFQMFRKRGAVK